MPIQNPSVGGGSWALLQEQTVSGSAVQTINFNTNVDLISSKWLRLMCHGINSRGSTTTIQLQMNGDNGSHYSYERCRSNATTVAAYNSTTTAILAQPLSSGGLWRADMLFSQISGNYPQVLCTVGVSHGSNEEVHVNAMSKTDSTANITSIQIYDADGSYIDVGSRFTLLRYTGQ